MSGVKKLDDLLSTGLYKTLSVDVFDTVLIRNPEPENLRFLNQASFAIKILNKYNLVCSDFYYYELREYYTHLLRQLAIDQKLDFEVNILDVYAQIVSHLASKERKRISSILSRKICEDLLEQEIKYETKNLTPNLKLIEKIKYHKTKDLELVVFISDMYLPSDAINKILKHFGIAQIFDFGYSSADNKLSKGSTRLYKTVLTEQRLTIDRTEHIHFGDNPISDVAVPRSMGIRALIYSPLKLRTHRIQSRILNVLYVQPLLDKREKHVKKSIKNKLEIEHVTNLQKTAFKLGLDFGYGTIGFANYLEAISRHRGRKIHFLSSEANIFDKVQKQLFFTGIKPLNKINRSSALFTLMYLLQKRHKGLNIKTVNEYFYKLLRSQDIFHFLRLSKIDSAKIGFSELVYDIYDNEQELKALFEDINLPLSKKMKEVRDNLVSYIMENKMLSSSEILVADIGWNATTQILLENIIIQLGHTKGMFGYYFGATGHNIFTNRVNVKQSGFLFENKKTKLGKDLYHPELIESVYNDDNEGSDVLSRVKLGMDRLIKVYQESEISPQILRDVSIKKLSKILNSPTKSQIKVFAGLKFHYGMEATNYETLVNISYRHRYIYRLLFTKPTELARIYSKQVWKKGFLRYYHLSFFHGVIKIVPKKIRHSIINSLKLHR